MFLPSTYPSSLKACRKGCHIGASSRMPMRGIFVGCCPHARFTLTASSRPPPPPRAMNSRRAMSGMEDFLPDALGRRLGRAFRTFSLPQGGRQVFGTHLNRSESACLPHVANPPAAARLALSRDRSTRARGKSQPFGSRARQRNGTSILRRALYEGRQLG